MTQAERQRLWRAAIAWHDREMARMEAREEASQRSQAAAAARGRGRARSELPRHLTETPRQARLRRSGERFAQLLRRHAPWLRPVILEWIVQPVAEMVNAIIDDRLGDNQHGK